MLKKLQDARAAIHESHGAPGSRQAGCTYFIQVHCEDKNGAHIACGKRGTAADKKPASGMIRMHAGYAPY